MLIDNTTAVASLEYIREHPFLMVDTRLFDARFKYALLATRDNLDESLDGVLIQGDNFQALNLLQSRYKEQIKCVYTDPPYNTKTDVFQYKDSYKHSSWLSMMQSRMELAKTLLKEDGVFFHHIDENEHINASCLLNNIFGEQNRVVDIVWKNSSKNGENYISMQHEYILGAVNNAEINKGKWKERKEGLEEIYKAFEGFRKKFGSDWKSIHQAALSFYNSFPDSNPIKDSAHYSWMDERGIYFPDNISKPANGYFYDLIHPITNYPCKKPAGGWRFIKETMMEKIKNNEIHFGDDHTTVPNNKTYLNNTENQSLTSIKYKDGRVVIHHAKGTTWSSPKGTLSLAVNGTT